MLPLVRVQLSTAARGVLRPSIERHEIISGAGGRVDSIAARIGETVSAGQPIARLDAAAARSRMAAIDARESRLLTTIRDLEALARAETGPPPAKLRSPELRLQWSEFRARTDEHRSRINRINSEFEASLALSRNDLVPARETESLRLQIREGEAAAASLLSNRFALWRERLDRERQELADLRAERSRLEDDLAATVVRAPIAGTIEEVTSMSPGSFLPAGQVLAVISPRSRMVAEAFVAPGRVGSLYRGMPTRLHIDAFDYFEWGALHGRISRIGEDVVVLDSRPVFRVTIALDGSVLRTRRGVRADLRKGMSFTAHFLLGRRTLLDLVRERASDFLDPRRYPTAEAASGP